MYDFELSLATNSWTEEKDTRPRHEHPEGSGLQLYRFKLLALNRHLWQA